MQVLPVVVSVVKEGKQTAEREGNVSRWEWVTACWYFVSSQSFLFVGIMSLNANKLKRGHCHFENRPKNSK